MNRHIVPALLLTLAAALAACDGGTADTTMPTTGPATSTSAPSTTASTVTATSPPTTTTTTVEWRLPRVHDDPGPGWQVTPDGVWVSEPVVRDAEWYAGVVGITVAEAARRNGLVEVLTRPGFREWLDDEGWFGGIWVEETAESWGAVLRVEAREGRLGGKPGRVERRLENSEMFGLIEFEAVPHSLRDLDGFVADLREDVGEWCLPR